MRTAKARLDETGGSQIQRYMKARKYKLLCKEMFKVVKVRFYFNETAMPHLLTYLYVESV